MNLLSKISEKFRSFRLSGAAVYPVIIILVIPSLLIINTLWNLKSFNRDANFIVRHQAMSVADTLKAIAGNSAGSEDMGTLLKTLLSNNEDIVSITIFRKEANGYVAEATTLDEKTSANLSGFQLNSMAEGFNEPLAAMTYSPKLGRNIWNVVVPIEIQGDRKLMTFQMDTKSINEILSRTSRDSFIVLSLLIIFTMLLLANHFYFYLRSLRTKQLEELDRLKDEFISMAAHELRAPITAITGYLELLQDDLKSGKNDPAGSEITVLTNLTHELNGLVEELLDVSRIEQGRLKFEKQQVNINEIIGRVITIMQPTASQKGLNLKFESIELPLIQSDPERLRQVITNLVSNSLKYTLKGEVTITAVKDRENIKVTVKDTGIGIPPEEVKNLFTKFHRVKDEKTADVRGTGLGLWITRQIVELLGGNIYVESIYGTGSSFSFTVPAVLSS